MSQDTDEDDILPLFLPLHSDIAMDRVETDDHTRLFRCSAIVLDLKYLESRKAVGGDSLSRLLEVVPVFGFSRKHTPIGACSLSIQNDLLVAELSLDYETEERLLIETGSVFATPGMYFSEYDKKLHVASLHLTMGNPIPDPNCRISRLKPTR